MVTLVTEEQPASWFPWRLTTVKRYYWVLLDGEVEVGRSGRGFDTAKAAENDWQARRSTIASFASTTSGDAQKAVEALKKAVTLIDEVEAPGETFADELRDVLRRFAGAHLT